MDGMSCSINEFKLRIWASKYFKDGSVVFEMISPRSALLTDKYGVKMAITLRSDVGVMVL